MQNLLLKNISRQKLLDETIAAKSTVKDVHWSNSLKRDGKRISYPGVYEPMSTEMFLMNLLLQV